MLNYYAYVAENAISLYEIKKGHVHYRIFYKLCEYVIGKL